MYSIASTKMIEQRRASSRRIPARLATKKCTEPVTSSSGNPTDFRRSDCHSESHQPLTLRTRCITTLCRSRARGQGPAASNFSQFAPTAFFTEPGPVSGTIACRTIHSRSRLEETGPTRNAPSRCRLRPAIRLTSAEAGATRRTINLGRSVLGASRTLGGSSTRVKASRDMLAAICEVFFSHMVELRSQVHALVDREKKKGRANAKPDRRIRRAGNAFVHLPDNPSASA